MKPGTYVGSRDVNGSCRVVVIRADGKAVPLDLRLDIDNHSPTGFEWGYGGSGPAQLALAILAHALKSAVQARRLHQPFKWAIIAGLPHDRWTIEREQVLEIVRGLEAGARDKGADNRRARV